MRLHFTRDKLKVKVDNFRSSLTVPFDSDDIYFCRVIQLTLFLKMNKL